MSRPSQYTDNAYRDDDAVNIATSSTTPMTDLTAATPATFRNRNGTLHYHLCDRSAPSDQRGSFWDVEADPSRNLVTLGEGIAKAYNEIRSICSNIHQATHAASLEWIGQTDMQRLDDTVWDMGQMPRSLCAFPL